MKSVGRAVSGVIKLLVSQPLFCFGAISIRFTMAKCSMWRPTTMDVSIENGERERMPYLPYVVAEIKYPNAMILKFLFMFMFSVLPSRCVISGFWKICELMSEGFGVLR